MALMSDGVYDFLGLKEVEEVLREKGSCQEKALAVIEKVNRGAGDQKDNASIILVEVRNEAVE